MRGTGMAVPEPPPLSRRSRRATVMPLATHHISTSDPYRAPLERAGSVFVAAQDAWLAEPLNREAYARQQVAERAMRRLRGLSLSWHMHRGRRRDAQCRSAIRTRALLRRRPACRAARPIGVRVRRVRRSPTTGDPDPEPPRPRARGPPSSRVAQLCPKSRLPEFPLQVPGVEPGRGRCNRLSSVRGRR
jgi:hypothetical protein